MPGMMERNKCKRLWKHQPIVRVLDRYHIDRANSIVLPQKGCHYSLFHPRGIIRMAPDDSSRMKQAVVATFLRKYIYIYISDIYFPLTGRVFNMRTRLLRLNFLACVEVVSYLYFKIIYYTFYIQYGRPVYNVSCQSYSCVIPTIYVLRMGR